MNDRHFETVNWLFCSEKFMVKLNKNGGPKNPEKVDRLCALFTVTYFPFLDTNYTNFAFQLSYESDMFISICLQDLSSKDLKRDLYIVAHVVRTGK